MSRAGYVDGIEVLWRPGCPFCSRLRRGLRRRAIATTEINIWEERDAAERVRAVTGGDETVPTVFVGTAALVNPSAREVLTAYKAEFPDRAMELLAGNPGAERRSWWLRMFGRDAG